MGASEQGHAWSSAPRPGEMLAEKLALPFNPQLSDVCWPHLGTTHTFLEAEEGHPT